MTWLEKASGTPECVILHSKATQRFRSERAALERRFIYTEGILRCGRRDNRKQTQLYLGSANVLLLHSSSAAYLLRGRIRFFLPFQPALRLAVIPYVLMQKHYMYLAILDSAGVTGTSVKSPENRLINTHDSILCRKVCLFHLLRRMGDVRRLYNDGTSTSF